MSFTINQIGQAGKILTLALKDNATSGDNYFTILIGKNGTGKSSLLARICREFISIKKELDSGTRNRDGKYRRRERDGLLIAFTRNTSTVTLNFGDLFFAKELLESALPERVIATTITPFDKFPIPYAHPDRSGENIYRYLGSRYRPGVSSGTSQIWRTVESLIFASEKKDEYSERLSKVFDLLDLTPRISVNYRLHSGQRNIQRALESGGEELQNAIRELIQHSFAGYRWLSNRDVAVSAEEIKHHLAVVFNEERERRAINIEVDFGAVDFIQGSLDLFRSISFLRDIGIIRLKSLEIFKKPFGIEPINIREASSGEQSIILTFLGVASEIVDNSVILIDEPEISLHPEWQERFLPTLVSTFQGYRGCHFIIATHSPLLLSNAATIDGVVVEMETGVSQHVSELINRSADYQLAHAFRAPGFKNEYLMREALAALNLLSQSDRDELLLKKKLDILGAMQPLLNREDPVFAVVDSIFKLVDKV